MSINRIAVRIVEVETAMNKRISDGIVTKKEIDSTSNDLKLTKDEYIEFNQLLFNAVKNNLFSIEEADLINVYLGKSLRKFHSAPIHVRYVLTLIFEQLLAEKIKNNGKRPDNIENMTIPIS